MTAQPAWPAVASEAIALPPPGYLALMVLGLCAVSTAAPLIAATAAPALAIAFWRTTLASAAILPVAAVRNRTELGSLDRRQRRLSAASGAFLAGHFATWVPSIALTTVASSTALVSTQPVWAAVIARLAGRRMERGAWVGIGIAVAGAAWISGADLALSARALLGDALAVTGGMFAAAYITVGAAVRARISTTAYTAICYTTCSLLLLAGCLLSGAALAGYSGGTWLKLAGLTVGAQLLGHSLFNVVLRSTSATVVSLAILFEVPGAAVIAALWLGQTPPLSAVPGMALLLAGIAVVVRYGRPATNPATNPAPEPASEPDRPAPDRGPAGGAARGGAARG
ncbi:MAG TPA: DMT family transporter [Mycobacteriales bacterium]|nr:DMT family transporter [Mycobacteriales bacterium]